MIVRVFVLVPIDSFTAIDRYFAAFVCATYLLFTAILSINIFIGLISNALQTEAFSTVEARFLLERVEVILNYEWRLSKRKRSQLQELIHRYCAPLQLHWKDINFDAYGQSREQQQTKVLLNLRQTIDKQTVQFDTFRVQFQQKLNDIDASMSKHQPSARTTLAPDIAAQKSQLTTPIISRRASMHEGAEQLIVPQIELTPAVATNPSLIFEEIARLRELIEEKFAGQIDRTSAPPGRATPGSMSSSITADGTTRRSTMIVPSRSGPTHLDRSVHSPFGHAESPFQVHSQDLNERVTDLQLAVNRLHQDVSAIRQVVERMSPLSASLILGRTAGLK